jgi:hypothetical protein
MPNLILRTGSQLSVSIHWLDILENVQSELLIVYTLYLFYVERSTFNTYKIFMNIKIVNYYNTQNTAHVLGVSWIVNS